MSGGPVTLTMLAVTWCKRTDFQQLLKVGSEAEARDRILRDCNIKSRRELNTNAAAGKIFHEKFRKPFLARLTKPLS